LDRTLAALAARQHGAVTSAQLLSAGLSPSALTRRVKRGVLHRVYPRVYAIGHPRLSQEGCWMAAVLAAGEGAALSHLSAALLWEIWRGGAASLDVVTPRRQRAQPGMRVHSCRRLDPRDVTVRRAIPVTTVARWSI
jgi:predicted transcriptional regulator of viral defense system